MPLEEKVWNCAKMEDFFCFVFHSVESRSSLALRPLLLATTQVKASQNEQP